MHTQCINLIKSHKQDKIEVGKSKQRSDDTKIYKLLKEQL